MESQHAQQASGTGAAPEGRPLSFYLLMLIPVVLILSLHAFVDKTTPSRMAFGASCLFVFLGIALQRALVDLLLILRVQLRESPRTYRETLGEGVFVEVMRRQHSSRQVRGGHHAP